MPFTGKFRVLNDIHI